MTVDEVRQTKDMLNKVLLDEAYRFTKETGCLVEIRVTYRRVNAETHGAPERREPPVGFYESTVEVVV